MQQLKRLTARFGNGKTFTKYTPLDNLNAAWLMTWNHADGEGERIGWASGEDSARRTIKSMTTKLGIGCDITHSEVVSVDDGTTDHKDGRCRYLRVLKEAEGEDLCPKFTKLFAKGKRTMIVGETSASYLILYNGNEFRVGKRGINRLRIVGPWKGSPEFYLV